jgi:hypothetical protein
MYSEVPFDCTPEELDKIQFTVELWEENAKVAASSIIS